MSFVSREAFITMLGTRDLLTVDIYWQRYFSKFDDRTLSPKDRAIGRLILRVSSVRFKGKLSQNFNTVEHSFVKLNYRGITKQTKYAEVMTKINIEETKLAEKNKRKAKEVSGLLKKQATIRNNDNIDLNITDSFSPHVSTISPKNLD